MCLALTIPCVSGIDNPVCPLPHDPPQVSLLPELKAAAEIINFKIMHLYLMHGFGTVTTPAGETQRQVAATKGGNMRGCLWECQSSL